MARTFVNALGSLAAVGVATAASAYMHARSYTLRQRNLVLAAPEDEDTTGGQNFEDAEVVEVAEELPNSIRILHLSDLHMIPANRKLAKFVRELAELKPDFVVMTGDLVANAAAVPEVLDALSGFAGVPGVFVNGSNDYTAARLKNPLRYLVRTSAGDEPLSEERKAKLAIPTDELEAGLTDLGFVNLNNARATVRVGEFELQLVGVDDPHMDRDEYPELATSDKDGKSGAGNKSGAGETLRIGVTHAPYQRILDRMTAEGCRLVFAGHTHGGQVCLPGRKALVTNCDMPPRLASGLFTWPDEGVEPVKGDGSMWTRRVAVQTSAGLGTTPYIPLRTFCAPEAILLTVAKA